MSSSRAPATSDLLLKVTPPRVPRDAIVRAVLVGPGRDVRDHPVVLVQAPAGFGKTLLLAQWRREHLAHGAAVAWLLAQPEDDPARLVQALALAVRVGAGRPTFGHALLQAGGPAGLEGATAWLAEVAQSALNLVLMVDEADRLAPAARDALAYLLRNAPPNLRCIVAARTDVHLGLEDLVAYSQCVVVGTAQVRFTLEETIQLARNRFGAEVDTEAARVHELTEGWPLGVQLALSVAPSGVRAQLPRPRLQGTALRSQLLDYLLGNLAPADLDFLTRVSVADPLHPALCAALVPQEDAAQRLARLQSDTPVFVAAEHSDWVRLHSLAGEALRERLQAFPAKEVRELHARATDWLAAQGLLEAAAQHALASGQEQQAYALAERSLYELMLVQGRQSTVLDWVRRLPPQELENRPRLLLAAAWCLAVSERHEEASRLVARLLEQPGADAGLRWECALILGGAAMFADDPDHFVALHEPWPQAPADADPRLRQIHANRSALRALLQGEPALSRLLLQQYGARAEGNPSHFLDRWGDLATSLSYLWEGQVRLAEQLLRPALAGADGDLGRRSPLAAMLAALLAAALWESDQPAEVQALLANRMDVLERSAIADCLMLGYRALARMASASGNEPRALELLGALDAVGIARRLPRLRVASLSEQVRLHAREYRAETCRELCRQIDALLADPHIPSGPLWQRGVTGMRLLAHGHAAIAAQDWRAAVQPLAEAEAIALQTRQARIRIEALGLRAWALDRCGERARGLVREAVSLAQAGGLQRVFADAHPDLGAWLRDMEPSAPARPAALPVAGGPAIQPRASPSMALTPKEREVLELLARNLSNKEIGLAMQVGEETIKWHMKNLFAKLDAGTRKQVVSRSRILGLLADTS
ncbi:LuxR C-terminal-related transcriptional regulator [Ramlibacter sp. PS3R-8]|uniref:LuxR C-terminal-related transcriptional regulator n=1 Tax=Ramlibacter sp. PS3R-8 TaxID=3133437 RepID=UPI0030A3A031